MDILAYKNQQEANKAKMMKELNNPKKGVNNDDRFWTLDYDKTTKEGKAVIRPIGPACNEEDAYVTEYSHFIRRNNKILAVRCPTTAHKNCPICDYYFSKPKEERDKQFARTTKYIMNIYVVKDVQHPENNGKVFLWKCPVTIMNKIRDELKDTDNMGDKKEPINVFDMWEGANINLATCDRGGFLNYDNSSITSPKPIFEEKDNMVIYESLYKQLYPLNEFKEADKGTEIKEKFEEFMQLVDTNENRHIIRKELKEEQAEIFQSISDEDEEISHLNTVEKEENNFDKVSADDIFDVI